MEKNNYSAQNCFSLLTLLSHSCPWHRDWKAEMLVEPTAIHLLNTAVPCFTGYSHVSQLQKMEKGSCQTCSTGRAGRDRLQQHGYLLCLIFSSGKLEVSASCLLVRAAGSHVIFGTAFTAYLVNWTSNRALNGRILLVHTNPAGNHRLLNQEGREFITWVMNFIVKRLWLHIKKTYLIFIEFLSIVSEPVSSDINWIYVSVTC